MRLRRSAVMLSAAVLCAPVSAGADGAHQAVRSLTFDVDVHVAARREVPGAAISSNRPGVTVRGEPSRVQQTGGLAPTTTTGAALAAKGSIGIDVVAVTDDARLMIDVEETAVKRTRPKVRVAVAPEGVVYYDPRNAANLTEEELALVRWLARGFYGDHPKEPGTAWTVDQSANGYSDLEHYRVVARDAQRVTLDYTQEQRTQDASGFAQTRGGSLVYDTALTVPVHATFQSESRRRTGGTNEMRRTSVTLTLTADSFAKR
ncbi:MAG TPA: hypothetical protein VGC72_01820 [Candidatus Elarobacter sp.]|jgi:hypothetical protein